MPALGSVVFVRFLVIDQWLDSDGAYIVVCIRGGLVYRTREERF